MGENFTGTWRTPEKSFLEDMRKQSMVFLGHIISSEGIKIDPPKIETMTKMPLPKSVN